MTSGNSRSILIGTIFLVAGLLVGGALGYVAMVDDEPTVSGPIEVDVIVDLGDGTVLTYTVTIEENTPYRALMQAARPENGNLTVESTYYAMYDSVMVNSIAGHENGEDSKYWAFYVNDEMPMLGADTFKLEDGDTVKWIFEVPSWV